IFQCDNTASVHDTLLLLLLHYLAVPGAKISSHTLSGFQRVKLEARGTGAGLTSSSPW
ncbi:uncharacterized, partial [Tachysurus ichikawai]